MELLNTSIAFKYMLTLPYTVDMFAISAKLLMNDIKAMIGDGVFCDVMDNHPPVSPKLVSVLSFLRYYEAINHDQCKTIIKNAWDADVSWDLFDFLVESRILETPDLTDIINDVIVELSDVWESYVSGNGKSIGRLIGEVKKRTNGKADPREAKLLFEGMLT